MSEARFARGSDSHVLSGASAARLLTKACEASLGGNDSFKLEVVRDLALDLERHLEGLASEDAPPDLLAEAAQKCADLATLAVCNAAELDEPRGAHEAVRLAADAAGSLSRTVEGAVPDEGERNDGVRRDVRSAAWKSSLALRQMEDLLENG
jgi:hypothetical protein